MDGHDVVIHLASNPDIAAAVTNPAIDFDQGTALTNNVCEAMRTTSAQRILYASGSGVYGDLGHTEAHEDHGPLIPGSTYGASKLAGEALISSYVAMFDLSGAAPSASATWWVPARPTASASTSCGACSRTRHASRSWATAASPSPTSTWATWCRPC